MRLFFLPSVALLGSGAFAFAEPQITEFVAQNDASLIDGDGNASDWIEIHNPEAAPLNLGGYRLTDDPLDASKYVFANDVVISGGERLVVFASSHAEGNYRDGEGSLHTTFSLNSGGEYFALLKPDGSVLQEFSPEYPSQREDISYGLGLSSATLDLVQEGATVKWLVPSSDAGNSWQLPAFDDSTWTSSESALGYGYDLVSATGDTRSAMWFVNASIHVRVPFQVEDASAIGSLLLKMRYEDGFVAYLNGVRVASANAPDEASLTFNSNATEAHPDQDAVEREEFNLATGSLVTGTNILAIHGLNLSASGSNSSDFLLLAELTATEAAGGGTFGYFLEPTPGEPNGDGLLTGFVQDTKFSVDRGYHSAPFDVAITTETLGATIIYTTDGSPPAADNGTIYSGPLTISGTTTLRAMAMKDNFHPTNIDAQTYLFVEDILQQTQPTGYPTTWGGVRADYDMDPDIVNDPAYADEFEEAFTAMPTLSLIFEQDAFFHPTTGIYQRPGLEGSAWERPVSAEFFLPDGSEPGFQINAGVRIQGGSSRSTDTPKHSLSLRFRSQYGEGKLRYPLFENTPEGESAIEKFDALQLRPEYNFGWMHRHWYQADKALYGRDQWASDLFLKMGQNGSHGRWVHLFLNGIYWGLYDLHERPDADHMANYFGGEQEDYDTVNSSVATNGDLVAYNEMMDLAYSSIQTSATYAAIQEYLDIDAFIDYMILNGYVGNRDWDIHNWRAGRKREPGAKYLFYPWDTEFAVSNVGGGVFPSPPDFETTSLATNVFNNNGNRRPTGLQQRLELNAEYRQRYADRVRLHFFNGGPLSPEVAGETWNVRAEPMMDAIVAESARWGDHRRDVNDGRWTPADFDLYTRDDHYLPTNQWLVDTYIPQRSDIVLEQMRNANLYPEIDALELSQHGGRLSFGSSITISGDGTIYYTTNGNDPRLTGGNVNGAAQTISSGGALPITESLTLSVRSRAGNGEWSALTQVDFSVGLENLVFSEIMYHPSGDPSSEFIEIRNDGAEAVGLAGLKFTNGIEFEFDANSVMTELAAGGHLLIVRDFAAFIATYGVGLNSQVAGIFQNGTSLSNGGERLTLSDANDEVVLTVLYRDTGSWPLEADGGGRSLVFSGGDLENGLNWRASTTAEGEPGTSDSIPFTGGSLIDYALSGDPQIQAGNFVFEAPLIADTAVYLVQFSNDLQTWTAADSAELSQSLSSGGDTRLFSIPLPSGTEGYARVLVSER